MNILGIASVVAALGIFAAGDVPTPDRAAPEISSPAGATPEGPEARILRLAQTYSSKCVTPKSVCFVDPAPLGAPCSCGTSQGRIQR